jgi:hypothetical protein
MSGSFLADEWMDRLRIRVKIGRSISDDSDTDEVGIRFRADRGVTFDRDGLEDRIVPEDRVAGILR